MDRPFTERQQAILRAMWERSKYHRVLAMRALEALRGDVDVIELCLIDHGIVSEAESKEMKQAIMDMEERWFSTDPFNLAEKYNLQED